MEKEGTVIVKEKRISSQKIIPGRVYSYGCLVKENKGFALDINQDNLESYLEHPGSETQIWKNNRNQTLLDLSQKNYLDKK